MAKKFQGSWCVFFILLLLGIIPALIYYAIMYKEVTPIYAPQQQQQQQQVVIVQQPAAPQPTGQKKKFCSECGTEATGKFCDNCGAEMKL